MWEDICLGIIGTLREDMNKVIEELDEMKVYEDNKISVVICTHTFDRYSDTMDVIKSLNDQTYSNKEIILIIDRNKELYDKFRNDIKPYKDIKLGLSTLHGLSNARNKGVELSSGDIIAFIDDDFNS